MKVKDKRTGLAQVPRGLGPIAAWLRGKVRYRPEPIDLWSPPAETLRRGYGDCEDMALLKRALFLEGGGAEADALFVLVWDRIARRDHALLVAREAGQWWVLDSYNALVQRVEAVSDYTPRLAYLGAKAWTFGRPPAAADIGGRPAAAQ